MKFSHRIVNKAKHKLSRRVALSPKEIWAIAKSERLRISRGRVALKLALSAMAARIGIHHVARIQAVTGVPKEEKAVAIAERIIQTAQQLQKIFSE